MDVLTTKDKEYVVKIEGKEYEFAPINWNVLSGIETELQCSIAELIPLLQKSIYKSTLTLAWVMLRDKYPELTKDEIGKVTDHKEIMAITSTVSDVLLDFFGVSDGG
jgi:hypothetical protein